MWRAYQDELDGLFKQQTPPWQYWKPLKIAQRLSEETGEVAREVGHNHGGKQKRADEPDGDLETEIGDIIYTLCCFANGYGYDLDRAVQVSLRKSIAYKTHDPLSVLAKLTHRVGVLTYWVDRHYGVKGDAKRPIKPAIESAIGQILRVLTTLANQTGCTCDHAFHKSMAKVMTRDKDRFPEGT